MSITFDGFSLCFEEFFFKSMFQLIFKKQIQYKLYLGHCIIFIKLDLNDQRSIPIYKI